MTSWGRSVVSVVYSREAKLIWPDEDCTIELRRSESFLSDGFARAARTSAVTSKSTGSFTNDRNCPKNGSDAGLLLKLMPVSVQLSSETKLIWLNMAAIPESRTLGA